MDPFVQAETTNAKGLHREALERVQRQREARRNNQPMPEGGLFDEVARSQQDLFS